MKSLFLVLAIMYWFSVIDFIDSSYGCTIDCNYRPQYLQIYFNAVRYDIYNDIHNKKIWKMSCQTVLEFICSRRIRAQVKYLCNLICMYLCVFVCLHIMITAGEFLLEKLTYCFWNRRVSAWP